MVMGDVSPGIGETTFDGEKPHEIIILRANFQSSRITGVSHKRRETSADHLTS